MGPAKNCQANALEIGPSTRSGGPLPALIRKPNIAIAHYKFYKFRAEVAIRCNYRGHGGNLRCVGCVCVSSRVPLLTSLSALAAARVVPSGKVAISHGQGFTEITVPTDATPGESVIARPDSSAKIVYSNGCEVEVAPGTIATVEDHDPVPCKTAAFIPRGAIFSALPLSEELLSEFALSPAVSAVTAEILATVRRRRLAVHRREGYLETRHITPVLGFYVKNMHDHQPVASNSLAAATTAANRFGC